jgi:PAS domain S-box-containing protein
MTWLITSNLATCVTVLLLAVFHLYLLRRDRTPALRFLALGWFLQFGKNLSDLAMSLTSSSNSLLFLSQICAITSGLAILWGICLCLKKEPPRWAIWFCVAGSAWSAFSLFLPFDRRVLFLPAYLANGFFFIWIGGWWIRSRTRWDRFLGIIVGTAFILWGVNKWFYPLLIGKPVLSAFRYNITLWMAIIVVLGTIISHFQDARRELAREKERFRLLADNASDVIFRYRYRPTQGYEYVSPSCLDLTGYPPEAFYADPLLGEKTVHSRDIASFRRFLVRGTDHEHPPLMRFLRRDGREVWTEFRVTPIRDDEGRLTALEGIVRDVSERVRTAAAERKAEEELVKTQKLESIGVLAGGIAHDFNNLLTAIMGNISLARMHKGSAERMEGNLAEAEKATERARDLAGQLLTFARGGAPVKRTVALAPIVRESCRLALTGSNVRCNPLFPEHPWPVDADPGQLGQAIGNILLNAAQAMPLGGTVNVRVENLPAPPFHLSLHPGRYLRIDIEDHGIGITAEHLPHIFDPYFSTKDRGRGLGLPTAFSIVRNHGGMITVDSRVGAGTTFHVFLPAAAGKAPIMEGEKREETGEREEPLPRGSGRILVMDDEESVRATAEGMLALLGYEVTCAREGEEAALLYRQAQHRGRPFAAVILDLTIPGGSGGRETLRLLEAIDPGVTAIVSSGYSNDPVLADFRAHGFAGMVAKPYTLREMAEVMARALAKPG